MFIFYLPLTLISIILSLTKNYCAGQRCEIISRWLVVCAITEK